MGDGWAYTGFWTFSPEWASDWCEVLAQLNIDFWMTAKVAKDHLLPTYIFQTKADKDTSKKLVEKYGFEHEYPIGVGEGVL